MDDVRDPAPIVATLADPPNVSHNSRVGSWITYRRSHISLDILVGIPTASVGDKTGGCGQLHTRTSEVPMKRFKSK